MVKKTNELTPIKAVLIYSMALVLIIFSELPRVLSWLEETRWKLSSGQIYDGFGANLPKLVPKASDPAGGPVQAQDDPSGQADPKKMEAAQLVVCDPPPAQGADQEVVPADSSGDNVKNPVQAQDDPSGQADPKKMEAAQLVVCDPPPAQGADQEVVPADSSGDNVESPVQAQDDPSVQADPKKMEVAQLVVCDPPAAQGADQEVVPADSSGDNVESPVPQSAWQTNGQERSVPGTSSPKLKPHKVLLVGDSMIAQGFGPALQRELMKHPSIDVIRKGMSSTGFVHQEDFNWASALRELIQKNEPDLIVIHMGTNDPIDILDDSDKRLCFGNDKWNEVYASRVREFLKFISKKKIRSFWVGLPIMGSHKYCVKISLINSIVERECAKVSGCVYVDSWSALADSNGNYSPFLKKPGGRRTRIRAKDNVHLTEAGGEILSEHFLRAACEYVDLADDDKGNAPR